MGKRLAGILASSTEISVVIVEYEDETYEIVSQIPILLQSGDRPKAYRIAHDQLKSQLEEHQVKCACIKASAVSLGGTKKAHLESAEVRGVVMAAAAFVCETRCISKASVSRTRSKKVDEYLKDDEFWGNCGLGDLKKGMRQAAFMIISEFS